MLSKLRKVRNKSGLTQQQVASEVNMTKGGYSQIENGKRGLSYDKAVEISAVFGLKPDDIFFSHQVNKK